MTAPPVTAASASTPLETELEAGLAPLLKAQAYGLGFDLAGIARLGEVGTAGAFERWLARGYAGEMAYLPRWADKRRDTRLPYEGTVSAVVVAMSYGGREPAGPVARYARGDDYHEVMVERLRALHGWLDGRLGRPVRGKAYVDTGPILERDLARKAGLGWFGKNTMLVSPRIGSFFFLGALLVEAELAPDAPFEPDRCGTCRRCIDACPTEAIVDERVLDATRCISYLTIEQRGAIPVELRERIGGLVYGCDICQEVCPWNQRFARALPDESPFAPRAAVGQKDARTLARELLVMSQEEFSAAFRKSPMKRAKLRGLKRNAAVVLGNLGTSEDADVLVRTLDEDPDPVVREHVIRALARLG